MIRRRFRSSITGRLVKAATARRHPRETVAEAIIRRRTPGERVAFVDGFGSALDFVAAHGLEAGRQHLALARESERRIQDRPR